MANAVYKCPKCSATLKPAKPILAGKKIKCPKCEQIFEPTAEESAKPVPAKHDEDDLYQVKDEPQSEEADGEDADDAKKKYSLAADLLKKKGPGNKKMRAQAICQRPTNQMLLTSSLMCLSAIISLLVVLWPLLFSQTESPAEKTKKKAKAKTVPVEVQAVDPLDTPFVLGIVAASAVAAFLYNGLIAAGAVKMQSLESYGWAMMGSVLLMLPFNWVLAVPAFWWFLKLLSWIVGAEEIMLFAALTVFVISAWNVYIGVWNLITMRNPEVLAGFQNEKASS